MERGIFILFMLMNWTVSFSQDMPINSNTQSIEGDKMKDNITIQTRMVVDDFYKRLFSENKADVIDLFADDAIWNVPGNEKLAPWLGRREGKEGVAAFLASQKKYVESKSFFIDHIFVEGEYAVVTGSISSLMLQVGRLYNSPFVAHFTVSDNRITNYTFFEDTLELVKVLDMSDQHIELVKQYFSAVDNRDAEKIVSLFSEQAEIYFAQSGVVRGLEALQQINVEFFKTLKVLEHDVDGFSYTISDNRVVVEGQESGVLTTGVSFFGNRFCSVFEIENKLITRMYVYTDPAFLKTHIVQ